MPRRVLVVTALLLVLSGCGEGEPEVIDVGARVSTAADALECAPGSEVETRSVSPGERAGSPDALTAVHTWEISGWTEYLLRKDASGDELKAARAKYPPVEHPVVRVHPVTGKKILYVNSTFTSHIKGLPRTQSDALLGQLFALAQVPEFQARLRWAPGTLAVWNNRSTQHYAVGDFFPQHRKLHRITVTE